jgi:hypothetical protein
LRTSSPAKKRFIEADCLDNRLTLKTSTNLAQATVFLDTRLVDFQRPVVFEINGRATTNQLRPSLKTFCQTLLERGDPDLAFSVRKDFDLQQSTD